MQLYVTLITDFSGNSQQNHGTYLVNYKTLQMIMQHSHLDIVVKVDTKNKGLTFKCRLNAVNFIFLRQFVHN